MSRRKVLILVSRHGAAMKRDVLETIGSLRERFEVKAVVPKDARKAFAAAGVSTERWHPTGLAGVFFGIRTLRRITEAFQPDAIVAHNFGAIALALGTYPERFAARTIGVFHDPMRERELPAKFVDKRLSRDLRRAARLVAVNPAFARTLERRFDLPEGSIEVIPHAIASSFDSAPAARPPNRPGPVLGWSGALVADRSWETAIDTLALARKDLEGARLVIAGSGPARQFVAAHARQRKVGGSVELRRDLSSAELFAAIDLLLVPSSLDAQPHVLLEAAAYGVPTIGANQGALADALRELDGAWLVPDDAEGFAEGVRDAWSRVDGAWASAMAQRGAARAAYSREVVHARTLQLVETVAAAEATKSGGS